MDFSLDYTEEQQAFRKEVRAWLDEHAPKIPVGSGVGAQGYETGDMVAGGAEPRGEEAEVAGGEFRRKLGEKGWIAPTYPAEYGGAGLTEDHGVVISEELSERGLGRFRSLSLVAPALLAHGSEEQKRRLLPPILKGDLTVWQIFSEPEAGSDLASMRTVAKREGDEYVLNGQKLFKEEFYGADLIYTLANTKPGAEPRENITAFLIPTDTRGITIEYRNLGGPGGEQRILTFNNVRVLPEYVIGLEGQGWQVAQTTLELERGGMGSLGSGRSFLDELFGLARQTRLGTEGS
jgi:alkylation response protein AidB-like acyl-CoA dehydrogenase